MNRFRFKTINSIIIFFLCWNFQLYGQQLKFVFENLRKAEGLSNFDVLCLAQDKKGFIWIGTEQGLLRYDGYSFKKFQHDKNSPGTLSDNQVHALLIDRNGLLWAGTNKGLNIYDERNERFILIDSCSNGITKIGGCAVYSINSDAGGHIWIGTLSDGLFRITQLSTKKFYNKYSYGISVFQGNASDSTSLASNTIYDIVFDKFRRGWLATTNGLCTFYPSGLNAIHFKTFSQKNTPEFSTSNIWKLSYVERDNTLWILSYSKMLCCISPTSQETERLHCTDALSEINKYLPGNRISATYSVFTDNMGRCWVGTNGEGTITFKYTLNSGNIVIHELQVLKNDVSDDNSIISDNIVTFLNDHTGNLWLGSPDGLSRLPSGFLLFQNIKPRYNSIDFSKKNVLSIAADGNDLWIGLDTIGVWFLSQFNQKYLNLPIENETGKEKEKISNVTSLIKHPNGDLLIGTINGLFLLNQNDLKLFKQNTAGVAEIRRFTSLNTSGKLCSNVINAMACSADGTVWIATGMGLCKFNMDHSFTPVIVNYSSGTRQEYIFRAVCYDHKNDIIYAGSDDGIYEIRSGNSIVRKTMAEWPWLVSTQVNQIYIDKLNRLWIATNNGLNCFDQHSGKSLAYTFDNGITDNNVKSVIEDLNGNIWCGTGNGISYINKNLRNTRGYYISDGLLSNSFNPRSAICNSDGIILLGSPHGFISLFPPELSIDSTQQKVFITDLKILNKSIFADEKLNKKKEDFLFKNEVILNYDENFFSIDFSSIRFTNEGLNKYKYKLEGIDYNWVNAVNAKSATYNGVTYGNYVFRIKTMNNDGQWSNEEQTLKIRVKPPFYRTWWFYAAVFIILFSLITYVVRYLSQVRLRQQLAEKEKLLAIERERNRISEDLHDDLGSGLSSIAMITGVMKDLVTDEEAKVSAEDVSKEANELVYRMREIIWSMNSKNDTLENLLTYLHEYSDKYLTRNRIKCAWQITGNVPPVNIRGDKRENIFLVVKETLHNIVKYAESPLVNLNITSSEVQLKIIVFDNGKGFDLNNIKRFGNGLSNMKQRIETAGGEYKIESSPGKGTCTNITVPIN